MIFLAHRKELIDQASSTFDAAGIDHGVLKAGHGRVRPNAALQVASVQTLIRRLGHTPRADVVIIDECHLAMAQTYRRIIGEVYPDALVLGLTATPWRLDGKGLGNIFDGLVVAARMPQLVKDGYLVDPIVYAPPPPDLSSVKIVRGDYDDAQLSKVMATSEICGDVVVHWHRYAANRRTIAFASSIAHSLTLVKHFREAGVAAEQRRW